MSDRLSFTTCVYENAFIHCHMHHVKKCVLCVSEVGGLGLSINTVNEPVLSGVWTISGLSHYYMTENLMISTSWDYNQPC